MKIIQNLLLGSLVAFSTTVLAEPIYLKCSSGENSFNLFANEETREVSLTFLNDGDTFAGKGIFSSDKVRFHTRKGTKTGSNQLVVQVNRYDLTFSFKQRFYPSLEGRSSGLTSTSRNGKGKCSISQKEDVKRLF